MLGIPGDDDEQPARRRAENKSISRSHSAITELDLHSSTTDMAMRIIKT